jgi:hypothetical protein
MYLINNLKRKYEKIISMLIAVLMFCVGHAQLTIDSTQAFKAEGYVGILIGPKIGVDSGKISAFGTLRAGANVYWTPQTLKWFSFFGVGAIEVDQSKTITPLYLIGTKFIIHKHVVLTLGKIGTPMTELRPLPNSGAGQFEPWTKRQILPSALGGKTTFIINDKSSIVVGGFWRGTDASVELGAKTRFVQVAGYYMVKSHMFGAAAAITTKWVSETMVYNYKSNFAFVTNISVPKTAGLVLYSDIGFSSTDWRWIRGEWGVLKTFKIKFVKGLVGVGYAHENKGVWGYLQVNL